MHDTTLQVHPIGGLVTSGLSAFGGSVGAVSSLWAQVPSVPSPLVAILCTVVGAVVPWLLTSWAQRKRERLAERLAAALERAEKAEAEIARRSQAAMWRATHEAY